MDTKTIRNLIKNYKDFPKKGVVFRDISSVLSNPKAFNYSIDEIAQILSKIKFDKIVAVDARGFIFASALSYKINKGLIMCRKPSKLPGKVVSEEFRYEYAKTSLCIQKGLVKKLEKVLIIDDVLATGNTALATYKLIQKTGGKAVGMLFFLELPYLNGRSFLMKNINSDFQIESLIQI